MKFLRDDWPQKLQRNQNLYGFLLLVFFFAINAAVLATSEVMEAKRGGEELPFELLDPFIWEYTSALSVMLIVPLLHWLLSRPLFSWANIRRTMGCYVLAAIGFSVIHVTLMVWMRELAYFVQGRDYQFGPVLYEFIYEFRKDALTFLIFVIVAKGYRFIVSRLIGEANLVDEESSESSTLRSGDRLLVKKLGKEFIVKLDEVEWMESAGNYVNLHIKERIYPIRKTLTALSEEISSKGFCRVHRSHAINLDSVDSITPLPSGDGEVKLKSGKVLNISRRYKEELKNRLL